ncbi:MAG: hypothetical protein LQ343_000171 [Gyalolechia ehrenbergii]|nr:MAG: hypothetical protein LQ343_000171 [Gyalolechia ehrenbergii]
MHRFTLAALATFAVVKTQPLFDGFELSNPQRSVSIGGKSTCISGTIYVPVTALNRQILKPAPKTNIEVTQLYVELGQVNSKFGSSAVGGPQTVRGTYGIHVKLCYPSDEAAQRKVTTAQLLTHGGTFDHTYWDIAPGYSYVDASTYVGIATLSYDRLGTGLSDHPDPLQTVQLPLQIEIAHLLAQKLRTATISGGRIRVSKVVGVGHSLGGAVTQAVAAKYPKDFDALIIQGTSTATQYAITGVASEALQIANTDPSGRFKGLADGYHVAGPLPQAAQFAFYRYPGFDPKIFSLQTSRKQTLALGESYTLPLAYTPAPAYTGPVAIVNGQHDWFHCGGDCTYPVDQAAAAIPAYFPNANKERSTSYLAPGAGHSVNAHLSADQAFERMIAFLNGALGA